MDKIDLQALMSHSDCYLNGEFVAERYAKLAIHQALVLASEKAIAEEVEVDTGLPMMKGGSFKTKKIVVKKQSILGVEDLIV